MSTTKKRLQLVISPESEQAITRIRQCYPGLVTDSTLLTFVLVDTTTRFDEQDKQAAELNVDRLDKFNKVNERIAEMRSRLGVDD